MHPLRCLPHRTRQVVRAMLLALLFLGGVTAAEAQSLNPCDSLMRVSYRSQGFCCFTFTLYNYQQTRSIARVSAQVYSNSNELALTSATGPAGSIAGTANNTASWWFTNNLRFGITDSLKICLTGHDSSYYVIFSWWNNQQQIICSDTFRLSCPTPPQGCLDIRKENIECLPNAGALPLFRYRFSLTNNSNFTARSLSFSTPSGVTVSSNPLAISPALASGSTRTGLSITIGGANARPGTTVALVVRMCADSTQRTCCTDTIYVALPQCNDPSGGDCFDITHDSVMCSPNTMGYSYQFRLKNLTSWTARQLKFKVISPLQGVSISPSQMTIQSLPPGSSGNYLIQVGGVSATAGTTVRVVVTMCGDSGTIRDSSSNGGRDTIFTQQRCCSDTITFRLPECGTPPQGNCLDLVNSRVECLDSSGNNANGFRWCFGVRNLSNFRARYLYIVPTDPSVIVSPGTITLPSLTPGSLYQQACVTIFGSGAVPGSSVMVYVRMCDSTLQHCCVDSFRVELPRCGHEEEGCCNNFFRRFSRLVNSASSSGYASLYGDLAAGPKPITNVSATLVSSTVNGQPVYGYFNGGLIFNPLGPGIVVPPPYGSELRWPGPTVNLSGLTRFYVSMKFPPIGANISRDTLRYCIRFRYTNSDCVTCDTLVCFQRVRFRLFNWTAGSRAGKNDGHGTASAGGASISGSLLDGDNGTLRILLPTPPAEFGAVKYVGLSVSAEVPIIEATETWSGVEVTTDGGIAHARFSADPGAQLQLGMKYAGLGDRQSLDHRVIVRYVLAQMPMDTLEEEVPVTLRRGDGGDMVEGHYSSYAQVKTYAIHVRNANAAGEKIDRLVITAKEGAKIVAIGPTAGETEATVQFGVTGDGRSFVGEAIGGGRVNVEAGAIHGPIFLTLAGVEEEMWTAKIGFATLDANGQVISEGELVVSDPLSNVHDDDASTGSLALRAYPNPANGSATVRFTLPRDESNVTLIVNDATGREVTRLIDGQSLRAGEHVVFVNTAELASGSYFYTLRAGATTQTRSQTVAR